MAQLTGNPIQSSYLGLIKTNDNAAITGTPKALSDGNGNAINMELGTGVVKFPSGTVDFTGSTVQGLPSGGGVTAFKTDYVSETQATSSCDTVRSTVLIPANTFAAGDVVMMRSMQTTANQTGFTYSTIWITTNGTIGDAQGGENLAQIQSNADGKGFYEKTLFIQTSDGTGLGTSCYAAADSCESTASGVQGGDPIMDLAIDWTINQYLTVTVCIDNSGATWTNYGAILTKLN
jgi:hypothetical protein